jgi:predicted nucleic acid-binding protein
MNKVLLDTDVILDFLFNREPFAEYATRVIGLCEEKKISGYITPVICSNLYYLLRQTGSHMKTVNSLKQLLLITDVLTMDKDVVNQALHSNFKDFEDALQYYAAIRSGKIDTIITRNLKDYAFSKIGVLTPEAYIKLYNSSQINLNY